MRGFNCWTGSGTRCAALSAATAPDLAPTKGWRSAVAKSRAGNAATTCCAIGIGGGKVGAAEERTALQRPVIDLGRARDKLVGFHPSTVAEIGEDTEVVPSGG
jgi:hypothetical protein